MISRWLLKHLAVVLCILLFYSCKPLKNNPRPVEVAFLSDVHLTDIYGEFADSDFKGVANPQTGRNTILRTMQAQLHSTRLFNENYFAFLAALDDVVARGIRYVVLPGDFSDDGQRFNLRGLKNILRKYTTKYGTHFTKVATQNANKINLPSLFCQCFRLRDIFAKFYIFFIVSNQAS